MTNQVLGYHNDPALKTFWERVVVPGECWLWTGAKNSYGYGQVRRDGRMQGAHRVSFTLAQGAIPPGLVVRHRCENRNCVNPKHLLVGTVGQNNVDRVDRRAEREAPQTEALLKFMSEAPVRGEAES